MTSLSADTLLAVKNGRSLGLILMFASLIIISIQPNFLELTERSLADHMVIEHTLFFVIGSMSILVAEAILRLLTSHRNKKMENYRNNQLNKYDQGSNNEMSIRSKNELKYRLITIWSTLLRNIFRINSRYGFVWFMIAIILLAFWHLPSVFDYAALHENIHILQHISFIIVGGMGFLAIRSLGESFTIILLILLNAVMGFVGLLLSVLQTPIYPIYSINSHNEAGTYMLVTCIVLLLGLLPAYLVHRALLHIRFKAINNNQMRRGY